MIAFDLDGVVYDFCLQFDEFMRLNGIKVRDESNYNLDIRYGISKSLGGLFLEKFGWGKPFLKTPLYRKARDEMNRLAQDNDIYIITHRDWAETGIEDTLKRIRTDKLPVEERNIIFSKEKGLYANKLGIDMFYEDSVDNTLDILEKSNSLVKLVDTPYNQIQRDRIIRIKW